MASEGNPVPEAITKFCLSLLQKLSEDDSSANLFLSPFSISTALAMVMLGTAGETATQMSKVLCFTEQSDQAGGQQTQLSPMQQLHEERQERMQMQPQVQTQQSSRLPPYLLKILKDKTDDANKTDEDANKTDDVSSNDFQPQCELNKPVDVHADFGKLLSELNKNDAPYALSLANRLYGEKSYQFIEEFLADIKKEYKAELESVDFKSSAEEVRVNINEWVEKQTQGKIKDLLGKNAVDGLTRLVLVNAIYFKGNWNQKFNEKDTADAAFKINKNDTKEVKMMRLTSTFPVAVIPELNSRVLEMPYKGKDLSMLILLPDQIEDDSTGLEKLESKLTYEKFVEWTSPVMKNEIEVQVSLPRFKLEEKYDMKDVLVSMGMVDAFDTAKSDFSGMSSANDLVLSKVVHKAFVDVNEEGTEAAAATGGVVSTLSLPEMFTADHPFLFFIRHNPSSTILFAGKFCSPM
uniref:Serpin B6 n=1 Tax=Amphiprion percula TaxID=161767 RepID=A0A3P8SDK2_AMPPE